MTIVCLHDKAEIAAFLGRNPALNIYALGDLDDFFWFATTWYGLRHAGELQQVALVYAGPELPIVLAFDADHAAATAELLRGISYLLPRRVYAHLSKHAVQALCNDYQIYSHGAYLKLELTEYAALRVVDATGVVQLGVRDLVAIEALYRASYPGNWFDPRMLETGCYFGVWQDGALVSIAGIHVYSPAYRVAALGNITTHPAHRGRGLARKTTAALCQYLTPQIAHIGLNVHRENRSAIACYESLGFTRIATYGEWMLTGR